MVMCIMMMCVQVHHYKEKFYLLELQFFEDIERLHGKEKKKADEKCSKRKLIEILKKKSLEER